MAKHVSYRGVTIDMESLRRENERTPAIGNMRVNAKGDQIGSRGEIIKTADEIARENHNVKRAVVSTGLKGKPPSALGIGVDAPATPPAAPVKNPVKATVTKKTVEKELPSGDIIIEDEPNEDQSTKG